MKVSGAGALGALPVIRWRKRSASRCWRSTGARPRRDAGPSNTISAASRHAVGYDELMRQSLRAPTNVQVETGDMVRIHTGFADIAAGDERQPRCQAPCTTAAPASTGYGQQAAELDQSTPGWRACWPTTRRWNW
ncbi:hypothetical protein ACU4GD_17065 [Cupriavidus basilensis]